MKISLKDWIGNLKDELQLNDPLLHKRVVGFMEDIQNIFAYFQEAKNDEEKLNRLKEIEDLLETKELIYKETDNTILRQNKENQNA